MHAKPSRGCAALAALPLGVTLPRLAARDPVRVDGGGVPGSHRCAGLRSTTNGQATRSRRSVPGRCHPGHRGRFPAFVEAGGYDDAASGGLADTGVRLMRCRTRPAGGAARRLGNTLVRRGSWARPAGHPRQRLGGRGPGLLGRTPAPRAAEWEHAATTVGIAWGCERGMDLRRLQGLSRVGSRSALGLPAPGSAITASCAVALATHRGRDLRFALFLPGQTTSAGFRFGGEGTTVDLYRRARVLRDAARIAPRRACRHAVCFEGHDLDAVAAA
jgi:hypothetical protein